MFERFSEEARRTLFFARYEASQLGGLAIETEHLLLGLLHESKGLTGHVFARFGLSTDAIRREVEGRSLFREKVSTSIEMPFSQEVQRVLRHTKEESDRLSHNYIGAEHLLLGILREERSVAAQILIQKGVRLDGVREEIERLLNDRPSKEPEPDPLTVLAEENARLRSVIEYLLEQQALGRKPLYRDDAYWLQGEGEAGEGPYCAACWNIDRRLVLKARRGADGVLGCEYCRKYRSGS